MKKNFLLPAFIAAVAAVNVAFYLSEKRDRSELEIDSLEMISEGEGSAQGGYWWWGDVVDFCWIPGKAETAYPVKGCVRAIELDCDGEDCRSGYQRK